MRRPVRWSIAAAADLASIAAYVGAENPAAARRIVQEIRASASLLGEFTTGRAGRVEGTFEKSVPRLPYLLTYEVGKDPSGRETVFILRLIHGARDWQPGEWPPE